VLSYVSKNQNYDGRFRQITVKLTRPNLDVQTRKGYFAVSPTGSSPVLAYEAPALAALSRRGGAAPSALRLVGLSFPETGRVGLVPVLAEIPAAQFTFTTDKEKKVYNTDFSIVALIKDDSQQVVKKLSQHYTLSGPADKVEAAKRGEILFYREAELAPGRYTIEAIAYDALSEKASARTASVDVPAVEAAGLRLSSVVVLKRAERLGPSDQKVNNPFHFGEVLIYPNTGEPLSKAAAKQLAFFFTVYPARGAAAAPKLTLEVLQNGRGVMAVSGELPAPDPQGRIQYANALPLDRFQPGSYALKVTVNDGRASVTRSVSFTVEP
jgi:hypothetical protein